MPSIRKLKIEPARINFALIFILVCVLCQVSNAQEISCTVASNVVRTLNRLHFSPPTLDSEREKSVVADMINEYDPLRMYFLQEDVDLLLTKSDGLLDTTSNTACAFAELFGQTFYSRSEYTDAKIRSTLDTRDFDFSGKVFTTEYEHLNGFLSDQVQVDARIKSYVSYVIGSTYYGDYVVYDSVTNKETSAFSDVMDQLAEELLITRDCYSIDDVNDLKPVVIEDLFNIMALQFDPHSAFFSPIKKQRFQMQLSSDTKSFGVIFERNDNDVMEVAQVAPGGPAWNSGLIYEGDILNALRANDAELDFSCTDGYELTEQIDAGKYDKIRFEVRHKDGTVDNVLLERDEIERSDNIIRGLILEGETRVGYVALPSFYMDWSDVSGLGCANDLAREILSLRNDGIEGLILDLRNNGGGSMSEALELAGIFINEGTVLINAEKKGKPRLAKDPNRGVLYNDPLIVLVNGFSASASEIVSAVLQDYNRALIVGSTTYGKSTSQTIVPLLAGSGSQFSNGDLGYVKVTGSGMYRITKSSYQGKGVVPDVTLPFVFEGLVEREGDKPNVIKLDPISRKTYAEPLPEFDASSIKLASANRVQSSQNFQKLEETNKVLNEVLNSTEIAVSQESLAAQSKMYDRVFELVEELVTLDQEDFGAKFHENELSVSAFNETERKALENLRLEVEQDVFIHEAYLIMTEWVKFVP